MAQSHTSLLNLSQPTEDPYSRPTQQSNRGKVANSAKDFIPAVLCLDLGG